MTEAVIVSTARTPLCKSWRGALNMTHGAKMGGHVVHAALERARVDADEVEDVIIGCANPEGATGWNIARQIAVRAARRFKDEIVPITTKMKLVDKNTGAETMREVTAAEDEGIRPDTTYEGVSQIKPAIEGGCVAAGNASQFSDGAAAAVVMSGREAARRGLQPLGIFRGFAVAGCDPKEMGIGPVFAVPKLLEQTGKQVGDIDLWELNQAFAVQLRYCRDRIGIPDERLNVNGGPSSAAQTLRP